MFVLSIDTGWFVTKSNSFGGEAIDLESEGGFGSPLSIPIDLEFGTGSFEGGFGSPTSFWIDVQQVGRSSDRISTRLVIESTERGDSNVARASVAERGEEILRQIHFFSLSLFKNVSKCGVDQVASLVHSDERRLRQDL